MRADLAVSGQGSLTPTLTTMQGRNCLVLAQAMWSWTTPNCGWQDIAVGRV